MFKPLITSFLCNDFDFGNGIQFVIRPFDDIFQAKKLNLPNFHACDYFAQEIIQCGRNQVR